MEDPGIIGFCYENEEPSREAYNDVQYALRRWNVEYDPNNPNITGVPIGFQVCYVCNKSTKKRCKNCFAIYYCSKACQTEHWKEHREKCKKNSSQVKTSSFITKKDGEWISVPMTLTPDQEHEITRNTYKYMNKKN